jgi:hypothetical protein
LKIIAFLSGLNRPASKVEPYLKKGSRKDLHRIVGGFGNREHLAGVAVYNTQGESIAREFVAARQDEQGVLVLSRFTGAARELPDALLVNPYDIEQMAEAVRFALEMNVEERKTRMQHMRSIVREHNIYRWAGTLIGELCAVRLVGHPPRGQSAEAIRIDQSINDFHHPGPVTATGNEVGTLLERRYGVGHGHRATAKAQKFMIVLRIADSHDAPARNPQVRQHGGKACGLVDPTRQDHHRFFVKDHLQAEVQFSDRQKDGGIMRSNRCHNALSYGKRYPLPTQMGHEFAGSGRAQELIFTSCWAMKQRTVFSDNPVKEMEARKHFAQAGKFAAGDQYQLSTRFPRPYQHSQGVTVDPPIASQSSIVVRGYRPKSHSFSFSYNDKW